MFLTTEQMVALRVAAEEVVVLEHLTVGLCKFQQEMVVREVLAQQSSNLTGKMTLENALLTAIGSVTSCLVVVVKLLWRKSEECERDRRALRLEIETLKSENGLAVGKLQAFNSCPHEDQCPLYRLAQTNQ